MELRGKGIIIDANMWVAFFDKSDALHEAANKYMVDIPSKNANVIVTDFLIQEIITVFLYKNKPSSVKKFLDFLKTERLVATVGIDTKLLDEVMRFIDIHSYKPKLSLTDWAILYLSTEFNFSLLTFDKQLMNTYRRFTRQASHI